MTAERRAREIAEALVVTLGLHGDIARSESDADTIAEAITSEVVRVLEEAARRRCDGCAGGPPRTTSSGLRVHTDGLQGLAPCLSDDLLTLAAAYRDGGVAPEEDGDG